MGVIQVLISAAKWRLTVAEILHSATIQSDLQTFFTTFPPHKHKLKPNEAKEMPWVLWIIEREQMVVGSTSGAETF